MFSQLFAVAAVAVVASALPTGGAPPASQCNVGSVSCCNSLQSADSASLSGIFALLGINVQDVTGQVGLTCNPISVIGVGSGASCNAQPVCCTGNSYNGLVNLGCSPVNLAL